MTCPFIVNTLHPFCNMGLSGETLLTVAKSKSGPKVRIMAWRLSDSVVRGFLDNRTRGAVRGYVYIEGVPTPLILDLKGNAQPDIADCCLLFQRVRGKALALKGFVTPSNPAHLQSGVAGHITASRKAKVLRLPPKYRKNGVEDLQAALRDLGVEGVARLPRQTANLLHVEWYSESHGRVLIESGDFSISISGPEWKPAPLTPSDLLDELLMEASTLDEQLKIEIENAWFEVEPDETMDEFQWESVFREGDALTDRANELFEKHADQPDFDEILARELGWDVVDDSDDSSDTPFYANDLDDPGLLIDSVASFNDDDEPDIDTDADAEDKEHNEFPGSPPVAEREGIDWVRDDQGRVLHPLAKHLCDQSTTMWRWYTDQKFLGDGADEDLHEMLRQSELAATRCAGALHHLAYKDQSRQPGYVVARLKRSLGHIHLAIAAASRLTSKKSVPIDCLKPFQKELFVSREQILNQMTRFRRLQRDLKDDGPDREGSSSDDKRGF